MNVAVRFLFSWKGFFPLGFGVTSEGRKDRDGIESKGQPKNHRQTPADDTEHGSGDAEHRPRDIEHASGDSERGSGDSEPGSGNTEHRSHDSEIALQRCRGAIARMPRLIVRPADLSARPTAPLVTPDGARCATDRLLRATNSGRCTTDSAYPATGRVPMRVIRAATDAKRRPGFQSALNFSLSTYDPTTYVRSSGNHGDNRHNSSHLRRFVWTLLRNFP